MSWYNFFRKEKRNTDECTHVRPTIDLSINGLSEKLKHKEALSISSVFSAVDIISNTIAELPIYIKSYKNDKIIVDNLVSKLLQDGIISKFNLIKQVVQDVLLYGNAFVLIKRAQDGTPIGLTYAEHGDVTVYWNKMKQQLYYMSPLVRGVIDPKDILHFYKNSNDGINGRGILNYASATIELSKVIDENAGKLFKNGVLNGILVFDGFMDEEQESQNLERFANTFKYGNGGVAMLSNGIKYQPVSSNATEMQLVEERQFTIQEVARFFSINPTLLGDLSHSSYSSIEQALIQFGVITIMPYITLLQDEFNRKLFNNSNYYIDIDESYAMRSNKNDTANYLTNLVTKGVITTNEARLQLGLGAIEGGDKVIVAYSDTQQNSINNDESGNNNDVDSGNSDLSE